MNKDQERYQKSFQKLHLSEDFRERLDARLEKEREDKEMKKTTFLGLTRAAAAVAVCTAVFGVGGICYAADVGGIRTKIEIWRYGEKSEVEVEADGMGYTWTDENGETGGFGGVIMDENGNDVVMSAEELAEHMNNDCTLRMKDGRMILYYKNLREDVTDRISSEGTLHVHINDPLNPYTYFNFEEVTPDGSYHCSSWDKPEDGAVYIELDAAELSNEDVPAAERPENVVEGTYVISDGE